MCRGSEPQRSRRCTNKRRRLMKPSAHYKSSCLTRARRPVALSDSFAIAPILLPVRLDTAPQLGESNPTVRINGLQTSSATPTNLQRRDHKGVVA